MGISMRVGYVQTSPVLGDVARNVDSALALASGEEADLLVFPELFNTGYLFLNKEDLSKVAEPIPEGPTTKKLMRFAAEHSVSVIAGIAEKEGSKFYNSAVVINSDGDYLGTYRKLHLFSTEKLVFEPGNLGLQVFDLGKIRVGVMICFDWIFPEAARVLSLKGAHLIAHSANLVLPYAQTAMLARSIENRVFTITANRIGSEERNGMRLRFTGMSQITSPSMKVLKRATKDSVEVGVVNINPKEAENKNITELNNLWEDRRPAEYSLLVREKLG